MQRYRAFDRDTGTVCEVISINFKEETCVIYHPIDKEEYEIDIEDITLLPSTGAIDKNSNEIFQGDIVLIKSSYYKDRLAKIEYSPQLALWYADLSELRYVIDDCEVVGNEFNEELLQKWLAQ